MGKEGTQWRGVPLEERYQAALDRDEDRGLTIGESKGPTPRRTNPSPVRESKNSSGTKSPVERAGSNTATTGHGTPVRNSRFTEPSPSNAKGDHVQEQKGVAANGKPRPGSPMTSADNPHVGRAMMGPNAKKLADPVDDAGPSEEHQHGRRKGSLMQRLKTWSKRLSQDRKAQN